jgi:hypothetical protein
MTTKRIVSWTIIGALIFAVAVPAIAGTLRLIAG